MSTATKNATPVPQEQPTSADAGFERIKSEVRELIREKAIEAAQDHKNLPKSPTERSLDPKRVRDLVDRIRTGRWLPCQWATVEYEDTKYRMNGQHSSEAMIEAGELLPDMVAIHVDHYKAGSSHGMGLLFRQFDARMSSRTKQDVAGAYQGLVHNLEDISRPKAKLGIEGIAWYERAIEGMPVDSGDELYHWFFKDKYHSFLRWLDSIITIKTPEMLRVPVIGAMYATFITSESGSQEFWSHVAKADLADDSDPRIVLSSELVRIKQDRKEVKPPPPAEFYAKCIKAWNGFRAGDKIRTLNVNTKKGLPEIAA